MTQCLFPAPPTEYVPAQPRIFEQAVPQLLPAAQVGKVAGTQSGIRCSSTKRRHLLAAGIFSCCVVLLGLAPFSIGAAYLLGVAVSVVVWRHDDRQQKSGGHGPLVRPPRKGVPIESVYRGI